MFEVFAMKGAGNGTCLVLPVALGASRLFAAALPTAPLPGETTTTPGQSTRSRGPATTYASRCAEVLAFLRRAPIDRAWKKKNTAPQAGLAIKWQLGPLAARLSLPPAQRQEAVDLYLKALRLADNTADAPWSTTNSLATTLLNRQTLPPQKELLERWNYDCSAGTINMRLYLYTAGYLAAETWPDFKDSATPIHTDYAIDFRGKTVRSHDAAEIKKT
jgi:hypothetical protein